MNLFSVSGPCAEQTRPSHCLVSAASGPWVAQFAASSPRTRAPRGLGDAPSTAAAGEVMGDEASGNAPQRTEVVTARGKTSPAFMPEAGSREAREVGSSILVTSGAFAGQAHK